MNVSDFSSQESTGPLHEQKFPEQPLIPVNTTNGAAGTVQDTGRRRTVPLHTDLRHQQGHKTVKHHQKQRRRHLQQPLLLASTFPSLGVPSSNEETVHRYARAYRAGNLQEIKTAKVSSVNVNPTQTSSTTRAFQNITGAPTTAGDPCSLWQNCALNQDANLTRWMKKLPNCPCQFHPMQLFYNRTLYDQQLDKYFEWRVMKRDKPALLRRTAKFCIRQLRSFASSSLAAQVCCYNASQKLITRGVGAGTPFLVSPDWSSDVHHKLDVLPIRLCNGDWTRYHAVRPPNNGLNCTTNPDDAEFARQVVNARDY